jgi:hypothetical protein
MRVFGFECARRDGRASGDLRLAELVILVGFGIIWTHPTIVYNFAGRKSSDCVCYV